MFVVGVDENGLGPRLGPLIVTAVTAEATNDAGLRIATKPARGGAASRLADSKQLVAYGNSALGEAWARALMPDAASPESLLESLFLDPMDVLQTPCPRDHMAQCWRAGESFESTDEVLALVKKDTARLAKRGLRLVRAEVAFVCTRVLNDAAAKGRSRFVVDLNTMERLVLSARARVGSDLHAVCGKVGGFDRYGGQFGPLSRYLHVALVEGRARSEYKFPGVGTVAFVRDADASSSLVSLASLIGKWARDLLTARVIRHYRDDDATLPNASGYHDPITARFVSGTALVRKRRNMPDDCFERTKVDHGPTSERSERNSTRRDTT